MRRTHSLVLALQLLTSAVGSCRSELTCKPSEGWEIIASCYDSNDCWANVQTGTLDTGSGQWISQTPYPDPEAREELEDKFASGEGGVTPYIWRDNAGFSVKLQGRATTFTQPDQYAIIYQFLGKCGPYEVRTPKYCVRTCYADDVVACNYDGCIA